MERRCREHKNNLIKGFTSRYNIHKLVYFEEYDQIDAAITREKQIKGFLRIKKIHLIDDFNEAWEDLCPGKVLFPSKYNAKKSG